MRGMVESGTFLIADISGYTEYLANSDIDHGPAIATDLLTRVVDVMRPRFEVNKVEGDAVFSYTTDGAVDGIALLEVIDRTYAAFRRRLLSVSQATSCGCPSCGLVPRLDLKLIAHSGSFSRQRIAGRAELVGSDVIIVHRLLKNSLGFAGAASGYMLVTDACVQQLEINAQTEGLSGHVEHYPHLGEVKAWVGSLQYRLEQQPSWQSRSPIILQRAGLLPAGPADVWDVLAPGRSESCVTNRLSSIHEVVEWRPFERLVVEVQAPDAILYHEVALDPTVGGTLATIRWYRGRRRRHAPSWEEIGSRLATLTEASLRGAGVRFGRSG